MPSKTATTLKVHVLPTQAMKKELRELRKTLRQYGARRSAMAVELGRQRRRVVELEAEVKEKDLKLAVLAKEAEELRAAAGGPRVEEIAEAMKEAIRPASVRSAYTREIGR